jgi:hypothetical protein
MDDERFMAVVEGLTTLNKLQNLTLSGLQS